MHFLTEVFLYFADRAEHVHKVIKPALSQGRIVLTDRYCDSTFAYQGFGRGIDLALLNKLNEISTTGVMPELTILLDLDVKEGLRRNKNLSKRDRFELEAVEFHEKVRQGFLEIARGNPSRVRVLDASKPLKDVVQEALKLILSILDGNHG